MFHYPPSLCVLTVKEIHSEAFHSKHYEFSTFLLLRGYQSEAFECLVLNDFPSKEVFFFFFSFLELYRLSH